MRDVYVLDFIYQGLVVAVCPELIGETQIDRKVLPYKRRVDCSAHFGFRVAYRHFVGVQPNDTVLLEENIKAKLGQLEDKSNEEIEAALNEVVEEGTVCISINMNPVFSSGKAEGTLKIENGPMNLYNQRVVITLAETGEEIYHSGLMPVDSHIQTDKLDVELEAGEYDAIATFHAYDVETDAEIGAAIAQIRISVLS